MGKRESGGTPPDDGAPAPLLEALESYLHSKGKGPGGESGNYRRNAERELRAFVEFLAARGVARLGDIDALTLRTYVREALLGRDLQPATVRKYYDYVSAWIGWAQREGLVARHYGIQQTATEPLPDTDTRTEDRQQTWRRGHRKRLLSALDERAEDALDRAGTGAYAATRDRALAYLLAYSGVRGAELLAVSADDRRDGASWADVGDGYASIDVLGKSQRWERRSVPPQARPALERWETVLQPEPDWPLVPSFHYPSLYGVLPDEVDTDTLAGYDDVFTAVRDYDRRPPALTTDGARRLFKRLTEQAGIDVDEGYLKLHGARRGVGRVLALQQGADAAADQLGNSVAVVEESYSDVLAAERAEKTGDAFDEHGG